MIKVALGANLALDLGRGPGRNHGSDDAAEAADPVLPVRACMTANVILRFVLLTRRPGGRAGPGGRRTSPPRSPRAT